MSFDLIEYYKALNGESSLTSDTWHINYDKRYAFSVYSDIDGYNPSIGAMYLPPSDETTMSINTFSDKLGQKLDNTKIVVDNNGNETVELELDDRIVTIIIDQSGSATWNDNSKFRHEIAKDLVEKININYPGDIKYNLIDYGAKFINVLLFGVIEEEGINPYDINSLSAMFQADENANYNGIRVVRNTTNYPTSPIDGDILYDGFVGRILDSNLTEGQVYYYTVYTYDDLGRFSDGVQIKVTPRDRIVPRGVSIFKTIVDTTDLNTGAACVGSGINRDNNTIGIWHMDEGEGKYVYDFSDSGFILTHSSEEPLWYESIFVPAGTSGLFFDGDNDYLSEIDTNNDFEYTWAAGNNALTISAWIYPYSNNMAETILNRGEGVSTNYVFKVNTDKTLLFDDGTSTFASSTITVNLYEWQYVSVTYDGTNITYYINTVSETVPASAAPYSNSNLHYITIGADHNGANRFRGKITEVSFHNVVRNSSYLQNQLVENPITVDGVEVGTEYIGIKDDNGDRLVVLNYEIPEDYNFSGGEIIIVKNEKHIPSWEEDGTILYQESASPGQYFVSDSNDFVLGEKYYYRIFSKNSLGNISFLSDSPSLEISIPEASVDDYFIALSSAISSPEEPITGSLIIPGNKKVYLRWRQSTPLDSRIARVKIYYSSVDYPVVSNSGGNISELVFTGLSTDEKFIHRNIDNGITAYYTIVNIDKYGRPSNYNPDGTQSEDLLQISTTPISTSNEGTIPLLDITNLNYEIRDDSSITIGWDQPVKSPENIEAYFDQTVLVYGSLTDEFGNVLPEYSSMKMYIQSSITRETQSDDVFNSRDIFDFSDIDAYTFFVTKTDQGFLKATLRMSTDERIISQIKEASFVIQLKSYIPKEGGYEQPNTGTTTSSLSEYAELVNSLTGDSENIAQNTTNDNVFEYFSQSFTVHFTNPWEITLEPKYESQRVYERCYYEKTDPITMEKQLFVDSEAFYGVPMRSSTPFVARAKVTYKGEPVENTALQIAVWDADSSNLCAGAGGENAWGYQGEKLQPSQTVLSPDNTLFVVQGTEERPGNNGVMEEVTISYVDIPLYAPSMAQAVRLFVKGEKSGYYSIKDMYILFQSILRIEITTNTPEENGLDVQEQMANAFVINPDYPDLTDPHAASLTIPVSDLTIVQWNLRKISGENNRNIYSIDSVPITNGIYSYTRAGWARNVFMGPIQIGTQSFDETHELSAQIVYEGMTASAKGWINLTYNPVENVRFGARFLMEVDGGWRNEGTDNASFGGGGWLIADSNPLWADGSHYKRMKIHRNPSGEPTFAATIAFNSCASNDDASIFELNSGQIVHIDTGDDTIEILHGEIYEEVEPYTGKHYLTVGENGSIDNGSAYIELNNESDSDVTYFYIRANKFLPGAGVTDNSECDMGKEINNCTCLASADGSCGKALTECDLPAWSPCFTVSGTTTLFVNNRPLVLTGGGDFYTGIPPCPICLAEPLAIQVEWRKVTNYYHSEILGDPSNEYLYAVVTEADDNSFKNQDNETLINHNSDVDIRVRVLWKGMPVPDDTPVYTSIGDNTSRTLFVASQNIYYTQTDNTENYSYVDVRVSARRVPTETTTEVLEIYTLYDENGKTDRHIGVNFNLTLDIRDEIIDIPEWSEENPSEPVIEFTPFTNMMDRYDINMNTWSSLDGMSESKGNFFIGEVDGKIYVMGGLLNNSLNISNKVEEYDILTGIWQDKSVMPVARFGGMFVTIGKDIYVIGGIIKDTKLGGSLSVTDRVEVYHTDTDLWEELEHMPILLEGEAFEEKLGIAFGTAQHVVSNSDNYIYIIGGFTEIITTASSFLIQKYNERILRYHIETDSNDSWEYSDILRSNELSTYQRISPLSLTYDNKIIIFNGAIESGNNFIYPSDDFYINIESIFANTPTDEQWIHFGSGLINGFPISKFQSAMARYDNNPSEDIISEYYILGGRNENASSLDIIENLSATAGGFSYLSSYDESESVALSSLVIARHGAGAVYSNADGAPYIYLIGGYTIAQDNSFVDVTFDI